MSSKLEQILGSCNNTFSPVGDFNSAPNTYKIKLRELETYKHPPRSFTNEDIKALIAAEVKAAVEEEIRKLGLSNIQGLKLDV